MSWTIRASMISLAASCERMAVAKTLPELVQSKGFKLNQTKQSIAPWIGTAVHRVMSLAFTGTDFKEAQKTAIEEFNAGLGDDQQWDKTTPDKDIAALQLVKMTNTCQEFVRNNRAEEIEQEYAADMFGVKVIGHLDLGTTDKVLWDYKSGARKPMSAALQLAMYSMLKKANGGVVKGIRQLFIKRPTFAKKKQQLNDIILEVREYPLQESEAEAFHLTEKIINNIKKFDDTGSQYVFTANPSNYLCAAKSCPAHGTTFCSLWKENPEDGDGE